MLSPTTNRCIVAFEFSFNRVISFDFRMLLMFLSVIQKLWPLQLRWVWTCQQDWLNLHTPGNHFEKYSELGRCLVVSPWTFDGTIFRNAHVIEKLPSFLWDSIRWVVSNWPIAFWDTLVSVWFWSNSYFNSSCWNFLARRIGPLQWMADRRASLCEPYVNASLQS